MNALSIDTESFQAVYFVLHGGTSLLKYFEDIMNKQRLNCSDCSRRDDYAGNQGIFEILVGRETFSILDLNSEYS